MNKKKIGIIILIIMILSAVWGVFAYGIKNKQTVATNNDKLNIVVTGFPQYDFARAVAKDNANIKMLIKPGVETHSYEPTPQDIQEIENADLFIYTGSMNDEWVDGILNSINSKEFNTVKLEECVTLLESDDKHNHSHEHDEDEHIEDLEEDESTHSHSEIEYDEHVWTSPKNAIKIIEKIETVLCELDKNNESQYTKNAEEYISEINEIDKEISDIVDHAKRKTLVFGDRFPFKYFVEEYGLEYEAAFSGCSDEMEPSADTISYLVNFIQKEGIPVVLYVELSNQKVANTLAEETNTKTMCLNSVHNTTQEEFENGVTYVSKMRENIETLKFALQ